MPRTARTGLSERRSAWFQIARRLGIPRERDVEAFPAGGERVFERQHFVLLAGAPHLDVEPIGFERGPFVDERADDAFQPAKEHDRVSRGLEPALRRQALVVRA